MDDYHSACFGNLKGSRIQHVLHSFFVFPQLISHEHFDLKREGEGLMFSLGLENKKDKRLSEGFLFHFILYEVEVGFITCMPVVVRNLCGAESFLL